MKTYLFGIFALALIVSISSCDKKFIKKDSCFTYIAEDYKNSDYDIMNLDLSHVESMIMYFYSDEKKYTKELKYKLVLSYTDEYDSKDVWYELGTYDVSENMDITFWPEGGETEVRYGTFDNNKESFVLFDPNAHLENEINFIIK